MSLSERHRKWEGHTGLVTHRLTLKCDTMKDTFANEVRSIQVYRDNLPPYDSTKTMDEWWNLVIKGNHYPELRTVVKPALSLFTAPHVEQCFCETNDLIYAEKNRTGIGLLNASITVSYYLKKQRNMDKGRFQSVSLNLMYREDYSSDPVDSLICAEMSRSSQVLLQAIKSKRVKTQRKTFVIM